MLEIKNFRQRKRWSRFEIKEILLLKSRNLSTKDIAKKFHVSIYAIYKQIYKQMHYIRAYKHLVQLIDLNKDIQTNLYDINTYKYRHNKLNKNEYNFINDYIHIYQSNKIFAY